MGEFADAAEAVLAADPGESGASTDEVSPESTAPVEDVPSESPESVQADSADPSDASPRATPAPDARLRDAQGRYAGRSAGPPASIPYTRFQAVTKERGELKTKVQTLEERFGWLGEAEAPVVRQFLERFRANADETLAAEAAARIQQNPAARELYAKALGITLPTPAAPPPAEDEEPKPDFYQDNADGSRTWFYSAEQQAKHLAWQRRQQAKDLEPIKAFVTEARKEQALGRLRQEVTADVQQMAASVDQNVLTQHRPAIRDRFRQYTGSGMDAKTAFYRAYADVLNSVVIPSLTATERRSLAASLHAKPGAGSPNPARPGAISNGSKPPASFAEAAERILARQ